ncbi:hypothetical protein AmDm5_0255 [Acetobacter malorum]|nr:hypothetical protein AmDm5_0255 [Acetobacter malorum]
MFQGGGWSLTGLPPLFYASPALTRQDGSPALCGPAFADVLIWLNTPATFDDESGEIS